MPECFHYQGLDLYGEQVSLAKIAERFGTPCYIYSRAHLENNWHAFDNAFRDIPHQICYAVKANSTLAILNLFARLNSGFDIVSVGELERVLAAGGDPQKIIFSGVAKQTHEIERALDIGIGCFNVESIAELETIQKIAAKKKCIAPIALRINPNIDVRTHPYIATGLHENKFGILLADASQLLSQISSFSHIKLIGLACHIGSQLMELEPLIAASQCLLEFISQCKTLGITLQHINLGGGLGVRYQDAIPPSIDTYVKTLCQLFANSHLPIFIEPGRAMVANAGILLTRVIYLKHTAHKNFAIVDAGMNDLLRPALYSAWHSIVPVKKYHQEKALYDIVGPVCESADFLGKNRELALKQDDLLAVMTAGAYGSAMSSHYNTRPKALEVMIEGDQFHCIRERESIADLFKYEKILMS